MTQACPTLSLGSSFLTWNLTIGRNSSAAEARRLCRAGVSGERWPRKEESRQTRPWTKAEGMQIREMIQLLT